MKTKFTGAIIMALTLALLVMIVPAMAYFNSVPFSGQGLITDGKGSIKLGTEICGLANSPEAQDPYMLWVLTASGAKNADISGPWGTATMTRNGNGTFTYVSSWYTSADLAASPVKAVYDGRPQKAQLVLSHGCPSIYKPFAAHP